MTEPLVFLNGEFLPASQAKLNIYDLGLVMGATFTEMTRTFRHEPFKPEDHIARLYGSLKYGGIKVSLSPDEMLEKTVELARHNSELLTDEQDLAVVHFVTPGENLIYAGAAAGAGVLTPTVCIHTFPLAFGVWRELFTVGAHVVTPAIRHIPPQCLDPKTKNRSRLHWWLADQQTHLADPKAISLLLDLDGNITECAGSNFLIAKNDVIYSPTSRNILRGVSLETVQEIAQEQGLKWVEKDLQPHDVMNADEAWLTTTPYCIAPCTRINGVPVGNGTIGPLHQRILAAWSKRVGVDIKKQILNTH
jgi:branched-chain amino acid aminotransferase